MILSITRPNHSEMWMCSQRTTLFHVFTILFFCNHIKYLQAIKVYQPAVVVANRNGEATVECRYNFNGTVEEMRVSLFKRKDVPLLVCAASFSTEFKPFETKGLLQCKGQPGPANVSITVSGLKAADTGTYICKMEIMYPPPYRVRMGNGTLVHVFDIEPCEDPFLYILIPSTVAAGLLLHSIVMTLAFCIYKLKSRKNKEDTDYENMSTEYSTRNTTLPYQILND
ncbi:cytotoxic T-lymphocyte protein 4-like [Protopterus annectens]|uniref:cytotoxic T-lymphocyte protein 4-like n=1 Tax=Protopterus annectens TaxID=7888 RepID=UPI001CF9E844|nr:cytotoxic T-lymphocyte protein 4-like [Protopterus annectens]